MLSVLLASMMAPTGGILTVGGLGVGVYDNGKWASMDSMFLEGPPVPQATVDRLTSGECYLLSDKGSAKPTTGKLVKEDDGREVVWRLQGESAEQPYVWFGPKPKPLAVTPLSTQSATYQKIAQAWLKSKGFGKAKPVLDSVTQADLDGNGTQDVVIVMGSKKASDMNLPFEGDFRSDQDFWAVIIRYASGKTVKTSQVFFVHNKAKTTGEILRLRAIWNLDGKPGAELLWQWRSYESYADIISQFARGVNKDIATAGSGA